jgi:hypothetical protein
MADGGARRSKGTTRCSTIRDSLCSRIGAPVAASLPAGRYQSKSAHTYLQSAGSSGNGKPSQTALTHRVPSLPLCTMMLAILAWLASAPFRTWTNHKRSAQFLDRARSFSPSQSRPPCWSLPGGTGLRTSGRSNCPVAPNREPCRCRMSCTREAAGPAEHGRAESQKHRLRARRGARG